MDEWPGRDGSTSRPSSDSIEAMCAAHGPVDSAGCFAEGTVFGDWRLTAFIGRGGSGEVYCAKHVALGTSAAVKVLVREEERAKVRFARESKLLSELKSASFPRFYAFGEANGHTYLAMELLEPGDLPSGDKGIARFLLKVCDAVAELHALGLVHRDIKPGNILWRSPTEPVLADLGLIKAVGAPPTTNHESRTTLSDLSRVKALGDIAKTTFNSQLSTTHAAGTPGYGAPEQMERGEVSFASDVHALGVLADRCFGGNPPRVWTRIIERATSSIPAHRYPSVTAFARAIRRRHRLFFLTLLILEMTIPLLVAMLIIADPQYFIDLDNEPTTSTIPNTRDYRRKEYQYKLANTTQLNGGKEFLSGQIDLDPGKEYQIVGPGTLEANLYCPTTATVRLKNCMLINKSKQIYPKSGIKYRLESGACLTFINIRQKPSEMQIQDFIEPYDVTSNEIRFGSFETVPEFINQIWHQRKR